MSNLLEKASILTTPTAYDDGKILSVKPEEVLGEELVVNGDFSDGSTSWNFGPGWSIVNENASHTGSGSYIEQGSLTQGVSYKVVINVTQASGSGFPQIYMGGLTTAMTSVGVYTFNIVAVANDKIKIRGLNDCEISSVSVKQEIDGDFDFTRNSSATRVNSQGLIEDVQILSSNLVSNGDFSQEGSELVTNGSFDSDSGWTLGTGWSIANGNANSDGVSSNSNLVTTSAFYSGSTPVKMTINVTDYVSGGLKVYLSSTNFTEITANGNYTFYTTADRTDGKLYLKSINFIGSIDNVSVKEVGQDWILGTGWSIGEDKATVDNTLNANLDQFISGFSGKKVKVSFEISDLSSGGILVGDIVNPGAYNATSNGIHTFDYTATNSTFRVRAYGNPCSITNISVIEITDDTNLPRINYEGFSYQDALGDELVTNGNFDSDSDWAKGTGWSISGGKANANNVPNLQRLQQGLGTSVVGKKYKYSLNITNVSGFYSVYIFGVYVSATSNTEGVIEGEVIATSTNGAFWVAGASASGLVSATVDNVSVKEYLGQEVVPDSGVGSWLFEPQSTNLLPYSEDFTQWNKSNASLINTISSTVVSPDGVSYANKLYPIGSATSSFIIQGGSGNCFSVFVKKGERRWVLIYGGFSNSNVWFDSENGVFGNIFDNVVTVESFGNDWYKIKILWAQNSSHVRIYNTDTGTSTQSTGNGTDGLYIWGAQLEVQSYATSYIPTNGSTVTRLQDAAFGAGSSDLINSTEGVLYAEIEGLSNGDINRIISISDETNNNLIMLRLGITANRVTAFVRGSGGAYSTLTINGVTQTDDNKIALVWDASNFRVWVNGNERSTTAINSVPSNINTVKFSNPTSGENFFGKTKCVAVFKEALTDAELTCLTTI